MNIRTRAWAYFDRIVDSAPQRSSNPWQREDDGDVRFEPDYATLCSLLAVPSLLQANTQSGVPALALDVWVAYELRRAGFERDRVWPRPVAPRVLPREVTDFVAALPATHQRELVRRISVRGVGGAASANILGKNYVKQVDVVMSSWATGPELMISTKRMDSSFGKNAANRVEESYGDAKNLRSRHPLAALGFLYGLGSSALDTEPETARWLIDLLGKLGREADAYDAVGLVIPHIPDAPDATSVEDPAGPLEAGAEESLVVEPLDAGTADDIDLAALPRVTLNRAAVPAELEPGRFFAAMCSLVLDRTPINFHEEARALRRSAGI
ncbi:MAG: hypothetical protein J0I14_08035 [Propionibacteriaceae bacterium]|nr:hypothetical protein [Propionibacteriaceae bacterium]